MAVVGCDVVSSFMSYNNAPHAKMRTNEITLISCPGFFYQKQAQSSAGSVVAPPPPLLFSNAFKPSHALSVAPSRLNFREAATSENTSLRQQNASANGISTPVVIPKQNQNQTVLASVGGTTFLANEPEEAPQKDAKIVPSQSANTKNKRGKKGRRLRGCTVEGCDKNAKVRGICVAHGAKVKRCSMEGCQKQAVNRGVCVAHGARVRRCAAPGCAKVAVSNGCCISHGGKVKKCAVEGCEKYTQRQGLCIAHGATATLRQCKMHGCTKYAKIVGLCLQHHHHQLTSLYPPSSLLER